jgi:hypothetical protein
MGSCTCLSWGEISLFKKLPVVCLVRLRCLRREDHAPAEAGEGSGAGSSRAEKEEQEEEDLMMLGFLNTFLLP